MLTVLINLITDYYIVISNGKPTSGTNMTAGTLPSEWVSTGENIGLPTVAGDDGTIDGRSGVITLSTSNIDNVNFGIDHQPESYDKTLDITGTPVIGVPVVLTEPLTGSDPEDNGDTEETWSETPIVITTLPTNGFDLVYNGEVLEAGDTIHSYDPTLLAVVPTAATPAGTTETEFTYATVDQAGVIDPTPAIYEVTFTLPLSMDDLLGFEAIKKGQGAIIEWSTKSEHTIAKFELQRSADSRTWDSINNQDAKSSTTSININYNYVDQLPLAGNNYYRLKVINTDGSIGYSNSKLLVFNNLNDVIKIHPNPAQHYVEISGLKGGENIQIIDITGRVVNETKSTNNQSVIDINQLPEGVYMINITDDNSVISTHKLIVTK